MAECGSSLPMKEDALKAKRKFITLCISKHNCSKELLCGPC